MFRIQGLTIFFLLVLTHGLWAQAPYNFYNLSLDKGLSDPRVNDIVQDKYGFMWFATPNGLNRFDGYSIKTFFADASQKELPANNILSLYSDSKGQLWIGTAAGPVLFDFRKQQFIHIDTSGGGAAAEVSRMAVYDFTEDANGNTYVGGQNGLFRLLAKENKWESTM
jgi:ligand-binding sensor domain-containing protein